MKREIAKRALAGDNFFDLNIVDCHCHMGPWYNFFFSNGNIDKMIEDADRVGINTICVFPHAAISCDYRLGNRLAFEVVNKFPERVKGLLTLNASKVDEVQEEYERYYTKPGFIGVKLHPTLHNFRLDEEKCFSIYDGIRKYGGFLLTHTWQTDPRCNMDAVERIIKEYPDFPVVMAHAGGLRAGVEKAIVLINRYENAYIDTSGFEFSNIWIEDITNKADPSKILFGSDCPFHDMRGGVSRILLSDIDDDVKKDILGENFRKMVLKNPKNN